MMQLVFTLPYALVLPNRRGIAATRKAGAAMIRKERERMAWEVAIALAGVRPSQPLKHVRVQVFRHSYGVPDTDNLYASCKPLLDVLQPLHAKRSYGLGIIENDKPARCELRAFDMKAPRRNEQFTRVIITEIDAKTLSDARRQAVAEAEATVA